MARMRLSPASLRPARWGVRARSALAAAGMVAVVSALGAVAALALLDRSLDGGVDAAAGERAAAVAAAVPSGQEAALLTADSRVAGVQLLDARGALLRSSDPAWTRPLLDPGVRGGTHDAVRYDDDLRVAVRTAVGPHGPVTVLAAADRESAERTLAAVGLALVVLWPLIVAAAAASTYALVGRSLRTVESIRARVAAIGSADLSRRVPVPPARDEIARLAETMNAMLARLEAGHAAQRRFVGDASHELRSPLATITAALELARDRPEMLDRELVSATLLPEAERMRRLVADLLTLAGADEHGLTLHAEEVDLDHVAEIEARAARLRRAGTPLDDLDADLRPARVIGDRAKLARVVANLLDNAATYARSRVGLATDMIGLDAVVTVLDDGPGIPAADRDRVLERFVRLDPDRARATGGAGLGLAIVAEIVAAHGGRVQIGEATGGGTRVTVRLPAQPPSR